MRLRVEKNKNDKERVVMELPKLFEDLSKLMEKYQDIPFGNSDVQNLCLVVSNEYSTGRKLRAYLLRLWNRAQALENAYFELQKLAVELKKLRRRLENEEDDLEKELLEIEIQQKLNQLKYTEKLYKDAVREALVLVKAVEALPEIDRTEFERQELEHFRQRLVEQLKLPEQVISLKALGYDISNGTVVDNSEQKWKELAPFIESVTQMTNKLSSEVLLALPSTDKDEVLNDVL